MSMGLCKDHNLRVLGETDNQPRTRQEKDTEGLAKATKNKRTDHGPRMGHVDGKPKDGIGRPRAGNNRGERLREPYAGGTCDQQRRGRRHGPKAAKSLSHEPRALRA